MPVCHLPASRPLASASHNASGISPGAQPTPEKDDDGVWAGVRRRLSLRPAQAGMCRPTFDALEGRRGCRGRLSSEEHR